MTCHQQNKPKVFLILDPFFFAGPWLNHLNQRGLMGFHNHKSLFFCWDNVVFLTNIYQLTLAMENIPAFFGNEHVMVRDVGSTCST